MEMESKSIKIHFEAFMLPDRTYCGVAILPDGRKLRATGESFDGLERSCSKEVGQLIKTDKITVESMSVSFSPVRRITLVEFKETVSYYETIMADATRNIRELQEKYLALAPFQPGDRVRVTWDDGELSSEAFIGEVLVGSGGKEYGYRFMQVKKDGTASSRYLEVYGYSKIEKINSGKN